MGSNSTLHHLKRQRVKDKNNQFEGYAFNIYKSLIWEHFTYRDVTKLKVKIHVTEKLRHII